MNNFLEIYNNYLKKFNISLENALNKISNNTLSIIYDSMVYAVNNGGKRIRPILCMASADMLGVDFKNIEQFCLAIEFIHSYSLVHDDLECMDNDDFRRGKLSTHKKYGEAIGVLCGDALLNYAFEIVLNKNDFSILDAKALALLADYAGSNGMILGQALDLENNIKQENANNFLEKIYKNKTSKLLTAPLLISSIYAKNAYYKELLEFGEKLGIMFQFTDDILDVESNLNELGKTPGKDKKENKFTSISIYGLEKVKQMNYDNYNSCLKILEKIPKSEFLKDFLNYIYYRKK